MKILSLIVGLLALPSTVMASERAPSGVKMISVRALGAGCLPDRTATTFSPDGEALTLSFDELFAEAAFDGVSAYDRKFCRVNVRVRVPAGWSFGIFSWDARGYVDLYGSAVATYSAGFAFSRGRYEFSEQNFSGPTSDFIFARDELLAEDVVYSPCSTGRDLSMRFHTALSVRAERPGDEGFLVLDSVDGASLEQNFGIVWRRCTPRSRSPWRSLR